ncbi:MmcQ/YjbR family DNA-binding protein [Bartonella sp. HY406]|uniref:MmcQ/YjbR family DNA-binding protein n=1 Tax=Bartonella sp. HY406 TaxID=2979331 RepID=UPI0021C799AD|nr:MmcQ/YjbR family DNA-binding protein [Bartonella sp. HY406]UXN04877.1 MmcQ/YjbR family DNA-binding protein [Bartonella sp. HY406]
MDRAQVFAYVQKKYQTIEEYPWQKYPEYAVLRHKDNSKWYGIILNVPREKIGLEGAGDIDVLDVKCDPALIEHLSHAPGFIPAYHMNKDHWIGILLDGTLSAEDVSNHIDKSFELTQ